MPSAISRKGKGRAQPEPKTEAALPLGKQLAHTDKKVRDQAVRNLAAFLSRGAGSDDIEADGEGDDTGSSGYVRLSESEMAKLWKGLFYCYWMSDKPLVQQGLATELSDLLLKINPAPSSSSATSPEQIEADRFTASVAFLQGFWEALVREWNGIDRLRIDKYYMLIRRYVNATFRLLARSGWTAEAVDAVNAILSAQSGPMTWQDPKVPSSLATHLADVYLDELDKVIALPEAESQLAAPVVSVLAPHIALLARTTSATVHTRLMTVVFTPLLTALGPAAADVDDDDDDDDDEKRNRRPAKKARVAVQSPAYGTIAAGSTSASVGTTERSSPAQVRSALLKALFVAAADDKAVESNRRKIYKLWREQGGDDDDEDENDG